MLRGLDLWIRAGGVVQLFGDMDLAKDRIVQFRISRGEGSAWDEGARRAGLTLSQWVRAACGYYYAKVWADGDGGKASSRVTGGSTGVPIATTDLGPISVTVHGEPAAGSEGVGGTLGSVVGVLIGPPAPAEAVLDPIQVCAACGELTARGAEQCLSCGAVLWSGPAVTVPPAARTDEDLEREVFGGAPSAMGMPGVRREDEWGKDGLDVSTAGAVRMVPRYDEDEE